MWFPEMARLGNDSLVALLVAGARMGLTRVGTAGASIRHYVLAGLCGGLGLLTKATFLPLSGVAAAWLIWHSLQKAGAMAGHDRVRYPRNCAVRLVVPWEADQDRHL
jgi:hypothetical protein